MKFRLLDILRHRPCRKGVERALLACDDSYYIDPHNPNIFGADRDWLHDHNIAPVYEPLGPNLLTTLGVGGPKWPTFACLQIGLTRPPQDLRPTWVRLAPEIEEAVVRCRGGDFLISRPSAAECAAGYDRHHAGRPGREAVLGTAAACRYDYGGEPWFTHDENRAYYLGQIAQSTGNNYIIELEYMDERLDDALGIHNVSSTGPNRFSCKSLGLKDVTWREVVAAHCGLLLTMDEALDILNKTR